MLTQEPDSGDPFSSGSGTSAFDMAGFLRASLRFWWIPTAFLLLGLGAGFFLVKNTTQEFTASSDLKVERRASTSAVSLTGNPLAMEGATTVEDLKTIEKSFINPMLIKRVVQEIKSAGLEGLTFGGSPIGKLDDASIGAYLMKDSKVLLIPDTRIIRISFTNPDPLMAQRICNMIVDQGIEFDRDQRIAAMGVNIRYLKDEVKKMEENLRTSEEKLNTYTRTLRNVSIDGDMNIVANQLKELNSRTTEAKAERLRIESDLAQIQSCGNDPERLLKIDSIRKMPAIVSLNAQIAESNNKLSKLALRYREDNPYMRQAQSELKELQSSLLAAVLTAPKQIEAALAGAKEKEEGLLREQTTQEEKVIQVRDLSVPSRVLQRQIDADRLAYEAALRRLSEELSQARSQPVLLQIVNPAGPGMPAGSKALKLFATSVVISLMAGFGLVFLLMQLDSSIKSPEEAEKILGLSVLSAIPEYQPSKDHLSGSVDGWENCPALTDKFSSTTEGIRSLRAALRVIEEEEAGNFILITSALEEEGKSFCAVNLAISMSQAGQRTLLVDADLRQPTLERIVFGNGGRDGLSNYLQRECGLPTTIHSTSLPNLDIVSAGSPCPFPAETITRQGILDFLTEAKPLYDKIVVDSAPVGIVSDTLSFARLFPFVCLVIRAGKTPKAACKRAQELLTRSAARLSGAILNFAPRPFLSPLAGLEPSALVAADSGIACPACGKSYASLSACLNETVDQGGTAVGEVRNMKRKCSCGHVFVPTHDERRDATPEGNARRQIFGELVALLEASGLVHEQARQQLLLTLKVWRNELSPSARHDTSAAGQERNRLFQNLLKRLVQTGLTEEEASAKMLHAAETWRKAS
ncbi:MAG: polysaccharide biosynthesis tyrosine autokinase [Chthoniobacterales bacterium]|nr:polysaccharide biosynthesis tyrosine autokinase [Chthoniobacterales bacterium]